MIQIDMLKIICIWLFQSRIVTRSYNCLLRIIISYLKPYNYVQLNNLLNRNNYLNWIFISIR